MDRCLTRQRDCCSSAPGTYKGGLRRPVLDRVLAYLECNLSRNVSLGELGRVAGISRFHFARQFRVSTGESPMGYLRRIRIERAKPILRSRSLTVAQVANRFGFADQSHFTRTFGRLVGLSPARYSGLEGDPGVV